MICGLIIGLIRFILEFVYTVPACEIAFTDRRPAAVKFHFLYFAILLFVLTCLVAITISFLTRPIPDQCVRSIRDLHRKRKELFVVCISFSLVTRFKCLRFEQSSETNTDSYQTWSIA